MADRWQMSASLVLCVLFIAVGDTGASWITTRYHSTWQSSTKLGATSSRAIDGKSYSSLSRKSCTYTSYDQPAWWAVDLGKTYVIEKVVVVSRNMLRSRSANYVVRVTEKQPPLKNKADLETFRTCGQYQGTPPVKSQVTCAPGTRGRYLYVTIAVGYLTLCEVEIHGTESYCGNATYAPLMFRRSRIINGWEARPHSWPWLAAMIDVGRKTPMCSAAILDELHLLTAAHCVNGPTSSWRRTTKSSQRRVFLGVHDFKNDTETHQIRFADPIIHPDYEKWTHENDIALLKLTEPIKFTPEIGPICLPGPNDFLKTGDVCYVAGWGQTESGARSDKLQQTDAPVIAQSLCNSTEWYDGAVLPSMVCAGFEKGTRDSCGGDSGGPLMYKHNGKWYAPGLTSWGLGCAMDKKPGVYQRVGKYLDWIKQHM